MITFFKSKQEASYMSIAKCLVTVAALLLIAVFFVSEVFFPNEKESISKNCKVFDAQWYQILENGDREAIEVPGKIDAKEGETVEIVTDIPDYIRDNDSICFRTVWQDVDVYIDGELRESYHCTDPAKPYGQKSALQYVFVEVDGSDIGKELTYKFVGYNKYAGEVFTIYVGDVASIWFYFIGQSGLPAVLSIVLILLSLLFILICFFIQVIYKRSISMYYLCWTIFYCAIWLLSETDLRQLLFRNDAMVTKYAYWSLMMILVPLLIYLNDIQEKRYNKVHRVPIIYSIVVFLIGTVLSESGITMYSDFIIFIASSAILAIGCMFATITIDLVKKRIRNYLVVGIGIYSLLVFTGIEMVVFFVKQNSSIGTIFSIGLFILLITAIVKTGQDLIANENEKHQAVMATKAQAQFLANMSHEIRTPINAVIGMNEMIIRENKDNATREYAENIKSSSNMLLGLVNDVLDFSKIDSGRMELDEANYHIALVLQEQIMLLDSRANEKNLQARVEIDKNLPSVLYGDELRIKQIVTNLITNAVKYTSKGKVTLKVSCMTTEKPDIIRLCIAVCDTGIGIKQEDLSKLFDSFKRLEMTKNRGIEGTGLGLNIVKGFVELMNGDILVKSEYGKGSEFEVIIPQKIVDNSPIGDLAEATHKLRSQHKESSEYLIAPEAKVLVVDDNEMNLLVIEKLLKRTKMQVECVRSGEDALEATKKKAYHIILLDHMMPEMDGVEVLKKIKSDKNNLNQNSIIIALTANAISGCRDMYLEYGFTDYFSKPIQIEKLEAMIEKYLPEELVE